MLRTMTGLLLLSALALAGCTKQAAEAPPVTAASAGNGETTHDGWWCVEHGVPEEECALCSANVAADFKKKGDWCKEHDRPESQCFICHPKLEEKFAARYEAKYGTKPPAREE